MARKKDDGGKVIATNRKAFHDYQILERVEAGMALTGTEIKSLREGRANLTDSYVTFHGGEAYLLNAHISPYTHGNRENHEPLRSRKLLLHKRELHKLFLQVRDKGLTIVPLRLYFRGSLAKAEIALVRGKKQHDKRDTERVKEADREVAAAIKHGRR